MQYNFDEIIERKNTISSKWDRVGSKFGNPDALPMWVADMDFRCPQPVIDAVVKRAQFGLYGYPYVPDAFREATQHWVKQRHNWDISPGDVVFTGGVIPAMYNAVQEFAPKGSKVLIQQPVYYPFSNSIRENGRRIFNCPLVLCGGHYEIDFDALELCASDPDTHLMLLSNPHNPVSRVFTREELTKIGEICLRHHVLLFSDEIHSDFIYTGYRHVPIASISDEIAQNTITAIAPSKTFNLAGLRTASLIVPNTELRRRIEQRISDNRASMASTFGIDAYIAAYQHGEEYLAQLLQYLEGNIAHLDSYLHENLPKIRLTKPEGTYLMWLDCRNLSFDEQELDDFFIRKAAVACDAGHWFGPEGSGFMRMNIACPRATLDRGLQQITEQYQLLGL